MVEQQHYLLEWIDMLISVTLNPKINELGTVQPNECKHIHKQLELERKTFMRNIMSHVFSCNDADHIKALICQYHDTLIVLLDHTLTHQKRVPVSKSAVNDLFNHLISLLEELLSFIEDRFSNYLTLSERAPATYAIVAGKELDTRIKKLTQQLAGQAKSASLMIVLKRINHFSTRMCRERDVTFKDVLYQKELLKGLEEIVSQEIPTEIFSQLDKLLVYLNFNSKAYINELTGQLARQINNSNTIPEKMDKLLFYFKAFNQLHKKPDVVLNPNYHALNTIMENWFSQELLYLEKKLHLSVIPLQGNMETPKNEELSAEQIQRVLCIMSSDQIGLILRAADELRILVAKSMSEVFRTIVPHLSTPYKDSLSYDGMRSKSYVAEERDKQIAIETLERIIKKIKEY
ncbi:hypothetical protein ACTFAO_18325 [Sphingobacterium spiritivorum]|uniref:hypothetical protein n=1 Tax=Sphingobacterium spiritivorum TaxID=258 RepID=UPI003F759B00